MLAVTLALSDAPGTHPPIALVHGAVNGAAVWTFWQRALAEQGWSTYALDLRGHGRSDGVDLSRTCMADYAADLRTLIGQIGGEPIVMGWSLGGLVAMMAAAAGGVRACVALAPSTPARSRDPNTQLREGEFGPEEYGFVSRDPSQQRAMPDLDPEEREIALGSLCKDSRYARDDRQAGIVINSISCPLLIATSTADRQWPRSRYDGLWLPADYLEADGASHWGLVLSRRTIATLAPHVIDWLGANVQR